MFCGVGVWESVGGGVKSVLACGGGERRCGEVC